MLQKESLTYSIFNFTLPFIVNKSLKVLTPFAVLPHLFPYIWFIPMKWVLVNSQHLLAFGHASALSCIFTVFLHLYSCVRGHPLPKESISLYLFDVTPQVTNYLTFKGILSSKKAIFWGRVSPCSPGWPSTASWVLGL
jgi:hypothetical protein